MKKGTKKMWLSLIADDTIRKQAIDNYDEKYYYQIPIVENIKDAFSYSFSWEKSPQHIIYWLNILKNPIPLRPSVKIENTVVNVTSQEEWDLVSDYYGYEWISSEYIDYEKETCISCDYCLGCRIKNYKDGTILSFKEWENAICEIKENMGNLIQKLSPEELAEMEANNQTIFPEAKMNLEIKDKNDKDEFFKRLIEERKEELIRAIDGNVPYEVLQKICKEIEYLKSVL